MVDIRFSILFFMCLKYFMKKKFLNLVLWARINEVNLDIDKHMVLSQVHTWSFLRLGGGWVAVVPGLTRVYEKRTQRGLFYLYHEILVNQQDDVVSK